MFPQSDWQVTGAFVVAAIGLGIGFIWIVRIFSADPEPDHRAWRYRHRAERTSKPESHASDMTRGQSGRWLARVELGVAAGTGFVVTPFLYLAAPGFMGPQPPAWQVIGSLVVGAAGILIGFLWMVRIYRADPEPDQRAWRYRARD